MNKEVLAKLNQFKEELKEYQKTNQKAICHAGLENLMEVFLNQGHSMQSGTYCLEFLMDTYVEGLSDTLLALKELAVNGSPRQIEINKDILALIEIARDKYELTKEEIELFIQFFRNFTIIPITEENAMWDNITSDVTPHKRIKSVYISGRSPKIFKEVAEDGSVAYVALDTKVFSDNGGFNWYTNGESKATITLPYLPTEPEYIFLDKEGQPTTNEELIKEMYDEAEKQFEADELLKDAIKYQVESMMANIDFADLSKDGGMAVLVATDAEGNIIHMDNGDEVQAMAHEFMKSLVSKEDKE